MLSHLDYIFSSSDLVLALIWFLDSNLLEIEIIRKRLPVFHARAYPRVRVTPREWAMSAVIMCLRQIVGRSLVHFQLLEAKWHNLRCYAHCYATDYCCSGIHLYSKGFQLRI